MPFFFDQVCTWNTQYVATILQITRICRQYLILTRGATKSGVQIRFRTCLELSPAARILERLHPLLSELWLRAGLRCLRRPGST